MSSLVVAYILTAVISIAIAVLLAYSAGLSSQAKAAAEKRDRITKYPNLNAPPGESLHEAIYEEITEVIGSKQRGQKVSRTISELVDKELTNRIEQRTQELGKKYEKIIEEKAKNEEIVWGKYKRVLSEKKNTDAVIRSIAEGLVVVDANGNVVMMNPVAERLLGVSRKDKLGQPLVENLKDEQLVSLVKGAPDQDEREIELISQKDETKKILRASSAVIEGEDGRTIGMVAVLSDITKQRELEQLKSNFVANVSHELRTPLVAIDKSLSLILSKTIGEIPGPQEQLLTIAERNVKRLTLLINDLLDLSKLEAGKMEFKREPSSIEKIIDESIDGLLTWAKTREISMKKNVEDNLPPMDVDPNKIIQVLTNLLGNSIKFTPKGGTIFVAANRTQDNGSIQISVQDTGVGISKEALPKIFNKFYQAGERISTDLSGTGIGLSIVKEIVEWHGGKIWVESHQGQGAKFIFTVPLKS